MKVSIWDLDYYYAEDKTNCVNPDVMRISSYHKQQGDLVNFVLNEADINRPFDVYYIIKENKFLDKNPPYQFFLDGRVKWWGEAYRSKIKWKMSDAMLGCRPDYLLYPQKETEIERAEHLRFFNNQAKLLPLTQDYKNTFTNKISIVSDPYIWYAAKNDLLFVLNSLKGIKNLSFSNPILYKKLLSDKDIKNSFLNLKFTKRSLMSFDSVNVEDEDGFIGLIELIKEIKNKNPTIKILKIKVDIKYDKFLTKEKSLWLFERIKKWICIAKQNKIHIYIDIPTVNETPFNYFFAAIGYWTNDDKLYNKSWLFYLLKQEGVKEEDLIRPQKWSVGFRDLLRQTYTDKEFLLSTWGNKKKESINIPWKMWKDEFKFNI